jgi:hypothetical protein
MNKKRKKSKQIVHIDFVFITFVEILQMSRMKKYIIIVLMIVGAVLWCSCEDVETYADMKKKERACIEYFIQEQGIKVITKEEFEKDTVTNVEENEYVLFEDKGVYMQIVRRGEGRMMESGDRGIFMARYVECNVETGDTISGNLYATPDYFTCERKDDTFSASFTQGYMMNIYGSSAVPNGWLVPFSYIAPGRPNNKGAKVRLILPHSEGTALAAQHVYPTYYEITYIPEPNN